MTSIINCTIYGNSTPSEGDGIYCLKSSPYIVNTILWENELFTAPGSNPKLSYCNIQAGYPGLGNIEADPLFLDPNDHCNWIGSELPKLSPIFFFLLSVFLSTCLMK